MVSPEVMTNLGLQVKIHKNQRQADSRHNPQHKANEIMLVFPSRDYRYHDQPRQTRFQ